MTSDQLFNTTNAMPRENPAEEEQPAGDAAARIRVEGQALLDAADAAIARALSRDSVQFLAQNRQTGGQ